jgi:hypothetical protein
MTTFVVITEHPPQLCQTSNAKCAQLHRQLGKTLAGAKDIPGFELLIGPLITSDHRAFLVVEADDYELVRKFAVDSKAIQWNSVTTIPVIGYKESVAELDTIDPIF